MHDNLKEGGMLKSPKTRFYKIKLKNNSIIAKEIKYKIKSKFLRR